MSAELALLAEVADREGQERRRREERIAAWRARALELGHEPELVESYVESAAALVAKRRRRWAGPVERG